MTNESKFWDSIRKTASNIEHGRALRGVKGITCPTCSGKGRKAGYDDYDSYGPIYVEGDTCRQCGGWGVVEIPCPIEEELAAVEKEFRKLLVRRDVLAKKMREAP